MIADCTVFIPQDVELQPIKTDGPITHIQIIAHETDIPFDRHPSRSIMLVYCAILQFFEVSTTISVSRSTGLMGCPRNSLLLYVWNYFKSFISCEILNNVTFPLSCYRSAYTSLLKNVNFVTNL